MYLCVSMYIPQTDFFHLQLFTHLQRTSLLTYNFFSHSLTMLTTSLLTYNFLSHWLYSQLLYRYSLIVLTTSSLNYNGLLSLRYTRTTHAASVISILQSSSLCISFSFPPLYTHPNVSLHSDIYVHNNHTHELYLTFRSRPRTAYISPSPSTTPPFSSFAYCCVK